MQRHRRYTLLGMPEEMAIAPEASHVEAQPIVDGEKRLRWFELFLVVATVFGGYVVRSAFVLAIGKTGPQPLSLLRCAVGIFQETTGLLLVGYILSRRKVRFADLGVHWSRKELLSGLGVTVVAYIFYIVGYYILYFIHAFMFSSAPNATKLNAALGHPSLLAIPFILLNPFFEELIVRAYLMTEIGALTGSWKLAALASVLLQGTYHLYYGWLGALSLSFQFLFFSIYYAKTRRATPIIIAHGAFDIWGLVRLW